MPLRRILDLTEAIYDAGVGGTPWTVIGSGLTGLLTAQSGTVFVDDGTSDQPELLYRADFPMKAAVAYQDHYRSVDLWTNRAGQAAARQGATARPRVWTSGNLVPDSEFLQSEFYVDFGRALGLRYVVGTVLPLGAAGVMPIGFHRPEGAAPFGETERRLLLCLLPHLRRSLQLRHHLRGAPAGASPNEAALDAMSLGVVVVNSEMLILTANASAQAMATDGSVVTIRRGAAGGAAARLVLTAGNHSDGKALATLVRAAALGGTSGGAVLLRTDGDGMGIAAVVAPLPSQLSGNPNVSGGRIFGQALILLRDLTKAPSPPSTSVLRDLFGLTRAEAETASALSGGATKEAVAVARGLRVTTVRTQVRAILGKTGATNLRDLERLLGHLPKV